MRILGIDPGSIRAGYAVLESSHASIRLVSAGSICMDEKLPFSERLQQLGDDLDVLIRRHRPTEFALENVFFSKNAKSALLLGQSRGVCLYFAAKHRLEISEYTPTQVKSAIAGSGRASKEQIQHMIRVLLRLPAQYTFVSHDHSDALAIAIAHVHAKQSLFGQLKTGRLKDHDRILTRKSSLSKPDQLRD
jgi:crossover junction endodeoxyribonuclease RuvC